MSIGAANCWYYYPAIAADVDSNMAMVVNRSCTTEFASIRYVTRLDGGALESTALLKAGEANYVKTFGCRRNRWGDYSGSAVDPAAPRSIWMFAEFAASPANTWSTRFGNIRFPGPGPIVVHLNIAFQAVPASADDVRFDVTLYHRNVFGPATADKPWLVFGATGDDLRYTFSDLTGTAALTGDRFTVRLPLAVEFDVYDIAISAQRNGGLKDTLANLRDDVPHQELATVDMGMLPEGNAVDDRRLGGDLTSIINALDASILAAAISKQSFNPRVDFDRDGDVDVDDLSLLEANYLKASPVMLVTQ